MDQKPARKPRTTTPKPRTTTPSERLNPFTAEGFKLSYKSIKPKGNELRGKLENGIMGTFTPDSKEVVIVDALPYSKMFHGAADMILQADITLPEYKLITYIGRRLLPKKDEIYIDLLDCIDVCNWKSHNVFYATIRKLIEKQILAKSVKGNTTYFVNPNYIYNGDRTHLYKPVTDK